MSILILKSMYKVKSEMFNELITLDINMNTTIVNILDL